MMVVEAFNHHPVTTWYTNNSKANDKTCCDQLLERLPIGGLLIFDLGFFKFPWFDAFTASNKFFLTRLREKTSYKVIRCLTNAPFYRDEIIDMGEYRSNPCQRSVRLVSVLWGSTNQPLDRSLYHFSAAVLRSEVADVVSYLVERHKLFGLVKYNRKRHREIDAYTQQIWALSS